MTRRRRFDVFVCGLLAAVVAAVYWPAGRFGFVAFDDDVAVYQNPHVRGGLTGANVRWAVTGFAVGHWEPLTWWSLQADATVWHLRPGPMHVENVLLHAAGSMVLYSLLAAATEAAGRAAAVAVLFAVHPMHVESVAWVTERRDVLSTPLLLAAVWAYVRHTRAPGRRRYAAFLAVYGLSLAAKATGITMPVALLLVDFWPLRRTGWRRLVVEKWPVAVLATTAGALAVAAQRAAGAASSLSQLGAGPRAANAVVTPALYVAKLAWPTGLAAFYPYPNARPAAAVIGAAAGLAAVTGWAWRQRQRRPYLLAGWGWFLVTLSPTSGVVQSGPQSMADRYSYVPSIGLGAAAVWAAADAVPAGVAVVGLAVAAGALAVAARRQVWTWRDTDTLQRRMMSVGEDQAGFHLWLGARAVAAGDVAGAEAHLGEAARLDPADEVAPFDLGNLRLRVEHDPAGAAACYRRAAAARPDVAAVQANWGVSLLQLRRPGEAYDHLRQAERIDPEAFDPHFNLGLMLLDAGHRAEAAAELAAAVRADPGSAAARDRLAQAGGATR